MSNSAAAKPIAALSVVPFAVVVQAATDDLIARLRALENSAGTAPRQIAIGRALSMLISNLREGIEHDKSLAHINSNAEAVQ